MSSRTSRPPPVFDVHPARRVPIAMSLALEVVAELRARERASAQRVVAEIVFGTPNARRR